ncbi:MAG: F420-nonreducing hydrogenase, partial [Deltaproteobacteria bacterium RBG_13_49_15]
LLHHAFIFEDHLLHFFYLGGPDLFLGTDAPASERNIFGVVGKIGADLGSALIDIRKKIRGMNAMISGSPLYPVSGLPGGVSKGISEKEAVDIRRLTAQALEFAKTTINLFSDAILSEQRYTELLNDDAFRLYTYYMGLVDSQNRTDFYDGALRVVDPLGKEFARFTAHDFVTHLEEHVVPWSYMKILSLKQIGWKGFTEGKNSGVYRVGPLARFNVSDGMATPLAQAEYERMVDAFGGKPVHQTMAYHWARLMEILYSAERMCELANDEELTDPEVRTIPDKPPKEGVGVCEAPRGTLIHHYETDLTGIIQRLNLLVATQNNAAAICMSVEKAARALIKNGDMSAEVLNRIEAAYRAYDPCLACATH